MSNHIAPPPREGQSPMAANKNGSHPRHIQHPCVSLRTHPCREDVIAPILEMWKPRLRELKCCSNVSGRAKFPPQRARCSQQLGLLLPCVTKPCYSLVRWDGFFPHLTTGPSDIARRLSAHPTSGSAAPSALQPLVWDFHFHHQNPYSRRYAFFFFNQKTIALL